MQETSDIYYSLLFLWQAYQNPLALCLWR